MRIFLSVGWEINKTTFEGVTKTRAASKTHLLSEKEDTIVSRQPRVSCLCVGTFCGISRAMDEAISFKTWFLCGMGLSTPLAGPGSLFL